MGGDHLDNGALEAAKRTSDETLYSVQNDNPLAKAEPSLCLTIGFLSHVFASRFPFRL